MSGISEYIWFLKSKISVQGRQIEAYKMEINILPSVIITKQSAKN